MERVVRPELLDRLAPDDPAALANRRDLARLNRWMGNFEWFRLELENHLPRFPRAVLAELGAGDGQLACALEPIIGSGYTGVDRWPRPPDWPDRWGWAQEDVLSYSALDRFPIVLANLLLHQFEDLQLRHLGQRLDRSARLLLCNEPARSRRARVLFHLVSPILHSVSRHDGRVSIAAGFRGEELPRLLGLTRPRWDWMVTETALGAYRLVAWRP